MKPRPDLFPARAALALKTCGQYATQTARKHAELGEDALRDFIVTGDFGDLVRAGNHVCNAIARDEGFDQTVYAIAIQRAGAVMAYGAGKHGDCTWRVAGTEQARPQIHYASACRHVLEYLVDPMDVEEGSRMPVLWHALSQIGILMDLLLDPPKRAGENDGRSLVPTYQVAVSLELDGQPYERTPNWGPGPYQVVAACDCNEETP